jgi:lipopolysaccharide biosynthesis regulator YciM
LILSQKVDSTKVAQDTALKLLQGAADKPNDVKLKVMENYILMHSGEKNQLEKALENFIQLDSQYVSLIMFCECFQFSIEIKFI